MEVPKEERMGIDFAGLPQKDKLYLAGLGVLALFIWLRDLAWVSTADDTVPILITLPLFYWLGAPWRFKEHASPLSTSGLVLGGIIFVIGVAVNLTLLLAIGWSVLLWVWVKSHVREEEIPTVRKLMVLPIMAFPWIALDAGPLGWYFRLTGAAATASLFQWMGFNVVLEGTLIFINELPISVEAACAGLNNLQSLLIAGTIVDFILLSKTWLFWLNIPLLFVIAWVANTFRIIVITTAAMAISPEFATGPFHTWGGWFILVSMFGLTWLILSFQEPSETSEAKDQK